MKKSFRRTVMTLIVLMLSLMVLPSMAEAEGLWVPLGADITLEGMLPEKPEEFTVRLEAHAASFPMPQGSTNGQYDIKIQGEARGVFPAITFDKLGVYTYTIRQLPGSDADCTYDARQYRLEVYVLNAKEGGLEIMSALYGDNEEKLEWAVFHNAYKEVEITPSPSPEPTATPTPTPGTDPTPSPSGETGNLTRTGIADGWPYYLAGAVVLLAISGMMVSILRRKGDDADGDKK